MENRPEMRGESDSVKTKTWLCSDGKDCMRRRSFHRQGTWTYFPHYPLIHSSRIHVPIIASSSRTIIRGVLTESVVTDSVRSMTLKSLAVLVRANEVLLQLTLPLPTCIAHFASKQLRHTHKALNAELTTPVCVAPADAQSDLFLLHPAKNRNIYPSLDSEKHNNNMEQQGARAGYHEPLALIVISSVSIGIAAIAALVIAIDIILRRGWRTMMLVMCVNGNNTIPVYVVNALYLWPITLWTYLNYGRPAKPPNRSRLPSQTDEKPAVESGAGHCCHGGSKEQEPATAEPACHRQDRPMFATITVAVCHCGAGCVLGDIIGEWIVDGAGITINGRTLWPAYLIGQSSYFAFAIAFGIVFQYYSIAPMTGDYGTKTLWRAAKADFLSLLFFEIGLFAWMAIFQIAIFEWKLEMNTVTYWWMMQVCLRNAAIGMFLGHWTGVPINVSTDSIPSIIWWMKNLLTYGIKTPPENKRHLGATMLHSVNYEKEGHLKRSPNL
ncbi:uncharacterized protein MYCFIDRAFT_208641 [Pseudocercospora fijiensis CIRAD86]|uniref:DUF4396 domain-containing protein n=1 Tax=Pseudocercospora fijiensis (strain CIRAD86) TaxID=383855 RepID=M3A303_PSEFD|nr:uncharacterized protein MYCFIDRAFT_208641 [Pseudocercospora fijiensis CIRAD86]EME78991.1 hypothetical protein MYCFIDRAFT_208641 [Pseudocercospora fijiensis CIRAD86]